jgi:double-strand break repair protein AddB
MAELWALPLGVDFAHGFVRGLRERYAVPEALARVTVFANSQRMRARIKAELVAAGVHLLPRLKVVSDLGEDLVLADLPPMAPALRRRLQLNQFIRALIARDPTLAPASAVQDLTESLFALMEEMDSEGVEPGALSALDVSEHSEHWARSQRFLGILVPFFAKDAGRSAGARQRLAALRLAEMWAARPAGDPVIVAGSSGSRGAIAEFVLAVAKASGGAVVLPGFDFDLPDAVWAVMDDAMSAEDHPQYRFRHLMDRLGLAPRDVRRWTDMPSADPARNAVISLALRPAPVTDQWLVEGRGLSDLPGALKNVAFLEATSPRQEAQAIALILREAAARGEKAALITPDRLLTRRVTAALDRWGIRPDDSAGKPLMLSAPGRFLRLVADLFCERLTAARLLVLLKHPMVMSGEGRGPHLLLVRELEMKLRRHGPVFPVAADVQRFAEGRPEREAAGWSRALEQALHGLNVPEVPLPMVLFVERHRALAELLARGTAANGSGELWKETPGEKCAEIFARMTEEAPYGGEITALDYRDLFAALLAEGSSPESDPVHQDTLIFGAREARECGAGLVILAGLNEGAWPQMPAPDPWLNRALRKEAGLLLPERQIGLSAHDFQQAATAPKVVLSRALRSDDSETVAARWLNRLVNLVGGLPGAGGPEALQQMRARGAGWLDMARAADRPGAAEAADPGLRVARRPRPVPPASARPGQMTLTELEVLIRDPYAIYAKRILNLRKLDTLETEPDAGDRGTLFHKVMERFALDRPEDETDAEALTRLLSTAAAVLGAELPFPLHRALWLARFAGAAAPLLAEDQRIGDVVAVERKGALEVEDTGVTLQGRLDRADRGAGGELVLLDFKSGHVPSEKEQAAFALQLLATAALVERGAFALPAPLEVGEIRYVGMSEQSKVVATEMTDDLRAATWDGLVKLLRHYRRGDTGFTARRALMLTSDRSDYDLLSRFGEWDLSAPARNDPVGGSDAG